MQDRNNPALLFVIAVTGGLVFLLARGAAGQVRDVDVLMVSRVCYSEAGPTSTTHQDCPALVEVLRASARRWDTTIAKAARRHSPRATGARPELIRRMRQRWVSTLVLDGTEPTGWPQLLQHRAAHGLGAVSWHAVRPGWLARVAEVRDLLATPRAVCASTPRHWGMRHGIDLARARQAQWVEIDCGATRNAFWRVPSSSNRRVRRHGPQEPGSWRGHVSR
jgi:hypothetical protein